jgi:ribosomal protein S27AE
MRFLKISGPGVATDEDFCPNCHILLDQSDDHKTCPLCRYHPNQHRQRRRMRRQQR